MNFKNLFFLFVRFSRRNMLKYCIAIVLWLGVLRICSAQEIKAVVRVDKSQINNISFNSLNNFAGKLQAYLNKYSWTNDHFRPSERIHAVFQITLLNADNNHNYEANIVIRSLRPIYNTSRKTTVFLFHDKNWSFHYTPNSDLIHDDLRFDDIATLLDYYANIIIGYDYDSFSPLGGSPFFTKAQHLVSLAQASGLPGWSHAGNNQRNRAQLVSNLLSNSYQPLRRACYIYYRRGLDLFIKNPSQARKNILKALHFVQKAQQQTTSTLLFDIFFNTKADELVSIFEDAATPIRLQAYNLLSDLDPSRISIYNELQ